MIQLLGLTRKRQQQVDRQRNINSPFLFFCLGLWAVLELIFIFIGVSPMSFPLFTLFLVIAVFIPGSLLLSWLQLNLTPLNRFALAWITGYPLTTFVFFLCRYFHVEWLYEVLLLVALGSFLVFSARDIATPRFRPGAQGHFHLLLMILYLIILAICALVGFGSGTITPGGALRFTSLYPPDFLFHFAVASELSHTLPPRIPFAPSFPLIYHYFPDLFVALFARLLNLRVWDLMSHFLPLFHFSLLFLSVTLLMTKLAKKQWTVLLALILVILGSNLAFLASIFGYANSGLYTFLEFQFVPSFTVLHTNPIIIGLTFLFSGCYTLLRYQAERRAGWLVISTLLFLSTAVFKINVAVLIAGGLGMLFLVESVKSGRTAYPLLIITVALCLLVLFIASRSPALTKSGLVFKPGYLMTESLSNSGLAPFVKQGFQPLESAFNKGEYLYLFKVSVLGGLFWLLGCFGMRIVGLVFCSKYLTGTSNNWALIMLSWVCWLGVFLSLLFVIPPEDSNIKQFLIVSLIIASLFTALFIESVVSSKVKRMFVTMTILLTIATSLTVLSRLPHDSLPRAVTLATRFLEQNTPRQAIIAAPQNNLLNGFIVLLSGRRSMYIKQYYLANLVGVENEKILAKMNETLFRSNNQAQLKAIIRKYQVDYIIEDANHRVRLPKKHTEIVFRQQGITIKKLLKKDEFF